MTRQLKPDNYQLIRRPFAVFVEPGDVVDGKTQWFAKVVGDGLDHITWGDGPVQALAAGADLVRVLAGECTSDKGHNWIVDSLLEAPGESLSFTEAWECARCGETAAKTEFTE